MGARGQVYAMGGGMSPLTHCCVSLSISITCAVDVHNLVSVVANVKLLVRSHVVLTCKTFRQCWTAPVAS